MSPHLPINMFTYFLRPCLFLLFYYVKIWHYMIPLRRPSKINHFFFDVELCYDITIFLICLRVVYVENHPHKIWSTPALTYFDFCTSPSGHNEGFDLYIDPICNVFETSVMYCRSLCHIYLYKHAGTMRRHRNVVRKNLYRERLGTTAASQDRRRRYI